MNTNKAVFKIGRIDVEDKNGNILFSSDTLNNVDISRDFEKSCNVLSVKDVLVNANVLDEIMLGKYDCRSLNVCCLGEVWKLDNLGGKEHCFVEIRINESELSRYKISLKSLENRIDLAFEFSHLDSNGANNYSMIIKPKEQDRNGW